MASLFKTRYVPNPDGSDSTTVIDNSNTAFVHTYVGDDFSGDGTREYPYKSAFKANQKSGVGYIVFRGVINEAFSMGKKIIGDDINQIMILINYTSNIQNAVLNCTMDTIIVSGYNSTLSNVVVLNDSTTTYLEIQNSLFRSKALFTTNRDMKNVGNIFSKLYPNTPQTIAILKNNIVVKEFCSSDLSSNLYCVFLSTCTFKHNNIDIVQPIWTNDSKTNIQLLRDAYLVAGITQSVVDSIFIKDSFGNETCRIVLEERNGGLSGNIFNKYDDDGSVLDFSLNPASNNEALYASDLGGYVGCFKPASRIDNAEWVEPIDVNESGVDSGEQGLLLMLKQISGVQSIEFTTGTGQKWNRARTTNTISIPNGVKFPGINCMSDDGSSFGYYFGKHQNLMGTVAYPADILEPNTIYKVCNLNRDIYSAAIYNGTQYLPDYFFKTGTEVLNFSLLNEGSGTFVRKVLATPLESIEVIPYDDMNTPSAFPKFSCPLFGDVQMLFWKTGERINTPILFSDIAGLTDKIPYYNDWAITNADQEFVLVSSDTENNYYKTPVLKFLRLELNAHFNVEYDQ